MECDNGVNWYQSAVVGHNGVAEENVSMFCCRVAEVVEQAADSANSIDETSNRVPTAAGTRPDWERYIRFIPVVGQL